MTDTNKYSNVSLTIETKNLLKRQSKTICSAPLSISKTVEHCSKFYEQYKDYIHHMVDKSMLKDIPIDKVTTVFCHQDDKVVVDAVALKCAKHGLEELTLTTKSKVNKHANSN